MNATNRALNRAAILIVGLVLLALGAAVAAAAAVPEWLAVWRDTVDGLTLAFDPSVASTLAIVLAACVVVIVLLFVFIVRQGRGHSRTLVARGGTAGSVSVDTDVAATLITDALDGNPAIVSANVSGYRVRATPALKIALSVRRGSSPTDLRETVDRVVGKLDAVLGTEIPVLVTIDSGLASRFAASTQLTETPAKI